VAGLQCPCVSRMSLMFTRHLLFCSVYLICPTSPRTTLARCMVLSFLLQDTPVPGYRLYTVGPVCLIEYVLVRRYTARFAEFGTVAETRYWTDILPRTDGEGFRSVGRPVANYKQEKEGRVPETSVDLTHSTRRTARRYESRGLSPDLAMLGMCILERGTIMSCASAKPSTNFAMSI
jgi:hypothetical protein